MTAPLPPVLAADQAARRIVLVDAPTGAVRWSWSADEDPGWDGGGDAERAAVAWNNVSEAKPRTHRGRKLVLTTASGGLAAAVDRTAGRALWLRDTGPCNLHSAELVPGGGIAVAASTEGFVRLYPRALGRTPGPPAEVPLTGAHGLQWDPAARLLYALGTAELLLLDVGEDAGQDTLHVLRTLSLPDRGGHDLAPVRTAPGRLWVSSRHRVAQLSARTGAPVPYPGEDAHSGPRVKAVGDDPATGRILSVAPEPGHDTDWVTSVLDVREADGRPVGRYRHEGAEYYKARWWVPRYW